MSSNAVVVEHETVNNSELIEEFHKDCELKGMTTETIRRYKSSILIFEEFLAQRRISLISVDKEILRDFLRYLRVDRAVKPKTIENYFSAMSSLYEYLEFEEYILKIQYYR